MKFSGKIGFWVDDVEVKPGVFHGHTIEKSYTGDILRNIRRYYSADNQQNEDMRLNVQLKIICDLFMKDNWSSIKYVLWNGVKWKVVEVDIIKYPDVTMQLGGVYNGETSAT